MSLDLQLHKGQLEVFQDPHKVRTLVCGRRWGKSRLGLYELLMASLRFPGEVNKASPETVLGTLPTLPMARKVLWNPLVSLVEETEFGKFVKDVRKTEFRVDFHKGKPSIQLAGALDAGGDRIRGMRLWFYLGDEFQDYRWDTFDKVVRPAMADTKGSRALITGTPKGTNNILHELFSRSKLHSDTYASYNRPTYDNPTIPWSEVIEAKGTLPPKSFRQEYMASFEQPVGQIYSELDEDNLVDKPPEMFEYAAMGVDFGETHPAFVVYGYLAGKWYYLDGFAPDDGQPVPMPLQESMLVRLAERYNVRATFCDPSRPTTILSIRELGKKHKLIGLEKAVAGFNGIDEGIEQTHSLIYQKKLLFNRESVPRYPGHLPGYTLYLQMASYHRKQDKNSGLILDTVADNQVDHAIDASRYLMAIKRTK